MTHLRRLCRSAAIALLAALASAAAHAAPRLWFDDFSQRDTDALRAAGWTLRSASGHPGVPGARWSPDAITLGRDADGTTHLQLTARTDGTPQGTEQAQLCHQRKAWRGTYAARVRLANEPLQGTPGDPVIQAFYAVAPLARDLDPLFSEIDWEYLAHGGWGSAQTRLYAIAWQTVQMEPWQSFNAAHEQPGALHGWHELLMQVHPDGRSDWFLDGRRLVQHGGRNRPAQPMSVAFSLWFSPTGLLPPQPEPRIYRMQVDWVLHVADQVLAPVHVRRLVADLRRQGVAQRDTLAPAQAATRCDF